jgi:pimeloyl-ACP methyl ester carboxylesterase
MPAIKTSDGVEIHYRVHGNGPINLIFLHGWGGSAETWNETVRRMDTGRFRCISIDLRGHGKSDVPASGYTFQNFRDDILAVADAEGARTFIPIGFSMGGKLACYLAAKNPDRASALILVATAAPGMVPVDRAFGLQVCREAGDWRRNQKVFQDWFAPSAKSEIVKAYCKTVAQTHRLVLEATAEITLWTSLAAEIGQLSLPALLVAGENDSVYGLAYQKNEMIPFLEKATTAILPAGHFIPLECPMKLAGLIEQFILAK